MLCQDRSHKQPKRLVYDQRGADSNDFYGNNFQGPLDERLKILPWWLTLDQVPSHTDFEVKA